MKKLSREHIIFDMSKAHHPAVSVSPGEKLIVETEDCFGNQIRTPKDSLEEGFDYSRVNPATGPIEIVGASPGDVIEIEILRISLESSGVTATYPGWGPWGERIHKSSIKFIAVKDNLANFGGLSVPVHPMIGVIGVAPMNNAVPNNTPGPHGGNLDTKEITVGAKVYLPVFVPGALLALGDLHAAMGDGEVCGTGVEIRGSVEVRIDVKKGLGLDGPVVEYNDHLYFVGSGSTIEDAVKTAVGFATKIMTIRLGLDWTDAYMALSVGADLRFSQVVNPLKTVKVKVPKSILTLF